VAAFPPPKHALILGIKLTVVLLIPLVAVSLIVGGKALLPAVMGFLAVAVMPYCTRKQAAGFLLGLVATGVLATMAARTWWAVLVVILACMGAGLASRVSAGVFGMAPIVASILALDPPKNSPLVVGLVMLAVGTYVGLILHIMKFHIEAKPLAWDVAVRHAVVMSVACGAATAVALYFDWPKAYWPVMTMAIVLKPYRSDSLVHNRQRILGTLLGAVIAVVLSPVPRPAQLLLAAICMTLMFAYIVLQDYVLQVAFMTPMIIFLVSTGTVSDTLHFDALRVLYTISACVVGGVLAMGLARRDHVSA
jgi:hypothetical protein